MSGQDFAQYLASGIALGSIYALIALGFTLIYNATGIINFAQGEFVILGGLSAFTFYYVLGWPLYLSVILAIFVGTLVGIVVERLVIYPLKKASILSLIIATIGVSMVLKGVAMILWGKEPLPFPHFFGEKPLQILGARLLPQHLFVIGVTLLVILLLQIFFRYTLTGKAMRAASLNKVAASIVGINVSQSVFLSFALSGALAGLAGVSVAPLTMMSFGYGGILGLKGFAAAVLGGLDNPLGALLGGLFLGVVESVGGAFLPVGFRDALALLLLLLILALRPQGILGRGEAE